MADHFIGLNRGGLTGNTPHANFTAGTSTGSTDVEVRMADAVGLTRKEVVLILKAISRYLLSAAYKTAPPL